MFPELFLFFALMINLIYCIYTISKFNKIKYFLKYKSSKVLFLNFYSNINIKRLYIKYFNFSLSYKFLINFLICCFLVTLFYLFNLYTLVVLDLSGGLLYLFDFFIIDLYSQFSKFFISLLFLIILFFFFIF